MPDFFTLLTSDSEEDRREGVLALVRERPPEARDLLERAATKDPSAQVRFLARRAVAYLDEGRDSLNVKPAPDEVPALALLRSKDPTQRAKGLELVLASGDRRAIPMLVPMLDSPDARIRRAVLAFFARYGQPADLPHLLGLVHDPRPDIRQSSAPALVRCGARAAVPYVAYLVQDPVPEVRATARASLGRLPRREALAGFEDMVSARETWQRDSAAWALAHLPGPEPVALLERLLHDGNATVRHKAQRGLARAVERGDTRVATQPSTAPPAPTPSQSLTDLLHHGNPKLRLTALTTALNRHDTNVLSSVLDCLHHETNQYVLARLIIITGHLGARENAMLLAPYLDAEDPRVVASAIESMHRLDHRGAQARLRAFLEHKAPRVRANALLALAEEPDVDVGDHLKRMLMARDYPTRLAALYVLKQRGPRPHGRLVELVMGDPSDEVRERAVALLSEWADAGHAEAKALHAQCDDGLVAIRRESLQLERAHPARRALAALIDAALFGGATALAMKIARGLDSEAAAMMCLAAGALAFAMRDALARGRGPGKRLLGLRVVDLASNRGCGLMQSLLRQALVLLAPVEIALMGVDPAGQRLGDRLAGTQVIGERRRFPAAPPRSIAPSRISDQRRVLRALEAMESLEDDVRRAAAIEAIELDDPRVLDKLADLAHDPVPAVRAEAERVRKELRKRRQREQ